MSHKYYLIFHQNVYLRLIKILILEIYYYLYIGINVVKKNIVLYIFKFLSSTSTRYICGLNKNKITKIFVSK